MTKTKVKANGISNLTDARYFAARGVKWLGLNLDPGSEHYLTIAEARAIAEWVDGVEIVTETGTVSSAEILNLTNALRPGAIQIRLLGRELEKEILSDIPIIGELEISRGHNIEELMSYLESHTQHCEMFLFDFVKNNLKWNDIQQSDSISIPVLSHICKKWKVLLHIDFDLPSLIDCLELLNPYGICMSGSVETKTGYKSYDNLDEIFDYLEQLD